MRISKQKAWIPWSLLLFQFLDDNFTNCVFITFFHCYPKSVELRSITRCIPHNQFFCLFTFRIVLICLRYMLEYFDVFLDARPFCGYQHFWWTLEVWHFCKLANKFWTVSARALIFHMSILFYKTFHEYQQIWPCDPYLGVWHSLKTLK